MLFAHPVLHKSRVTRRLISSLDEIENITIHDLYNSKPDFHIEVKREQELLLGHDVIVWQHSFYWYGAPAMLKEWIDLVLEHGWAYGRSGNALAGKMVLTVITTGGRREAYQEGGFNRYSIRQLLAPFEQTVRLCKMEYLPPIVVHGTHLLTEKDIASAVEEYKELMMSLKDGIFTPDEIMSCEYLIDILELKKNH